MSSPASFRSWENLVYHVISPILATRMAASVPPTPVMGDACIRGQSSGVSGQSLRDQ